jgi:Protein of unknown function (DUF3800)
MPTFIDESGDTGLTRSGGKPYFRLAAVWVPSLDAAAAFRESIRQLRRHLRLRTDYEFKFAATHSHPDRREAFFKAALAGMFRFAVCSIDKTAETWNSATGPEQHWACATTLASCLRPIYHAAEEQRGPPLREPLVVDDNSDGNFLKIVKKAFRVLESKGRPGSALVGAVSFRKSKPEDMLQMVDMVCGAVGAYIDDGVDGWYSLIRDRDLGTIRLP